MWIWRGHYSTHYTGNIFLSQVAEEGGDLGQLTVQLKPHIRSLLNTRAWWTGVMGQHQRGEGTTRVGEEALK